MIHNVDSHAEENLDEGKEESSSMKGCGKIEK